jgi:hypothetical protein
MNKEGGRGHEGKFFRAGCSKRGVHLFRTSRRFTGLVFNPGEAAVPAAIQPSGGGGWPVVVLRVQAAEGEWPDQHPSVIIVDEALDASAKAKVGAFCWKRWNRSVLWISPDIWLKNPGMKAMVQSAAHLLEKGWNLHLWCHQTTLTGPDVRVDRLRKFFQHWLLAWLLFPLQVMGRQFMRWLVIGRAPAKLIHTSINGYWKPDFYTVHFLNGEWCAQEWHRKGWKALSARFFIGLYVGMEDKVFLRWGRPRHLIAVGRGVAGALQKAAHAPSDAMLLLPTAYDADEFKPERRMISREEARRHWNFENEECVLAFAGQGSYERKGLFELARALELLWSQGHRNFRLLVFGTKEDGLAEMRKVLLEVAPSSASWLVGAGWVDSLAWGMSAADALAFPSWFESFSAVEAEACALGLPLALTPHWGSEMVLRPGVNGVELPWDVPGMAEALLALRANLKHFVAVAPEGTPVTEYPNRLAEFYSLPSLPATV